MSRCAIELSISNVYVELGVLGVVVFAGWLSVTLFTQVGNPLFGRGLPISFCAICRRQRGQASTTALAINLPS
jgi:hypothetical protein